MGCSSSKVDGSKKTKTKACKAITNNEDIRDKYGFGKLLGSGSFGQVREATLAGVASSEIRAVKMIERDNEDDGEWSNQAIFVREVGLLQQIKHENIVRYFDFYEDLHFLYVVMELCTGGEVFAKIVELKRFSERNAASLGRQMLNAIAYIHRLHIVHRDIKAENFMFAQPSISSQVKMIDFGMATKVEEGQMLTDLCGSPHYLAPELIGQNYDHRADVWSFGILLYLICYGHYPYDAKHPHDIMVKILSEPIRWQTRAKLSRDGLDFLKKVLEADPKKRPSAEGAMEHKWIKMADAHQDTELVPQDVLRNAHRKVTETRKPVDPKIEEMRNQKFHKINEDFKIGVRHGQRLGETPKEEYMSKPEFVRRENKITTAPSRQLVSSSRRSSLVALLGSIGKKPNGDAVKGPLLLSAHQDAGQKQTVHATMCTQIQSKRLSYIGVLSGHEEKTFASMYLEKKQAKCVLSVLPEPTSPGVPGEPHEKDDIELKSEMVEGSTQDANDCMT